ncbi:MAG: outer membrane lipoprotein carrier protein LolA, partial [Sphingomonadales bacterium]|nr:outer membrane lipoprotein carrier protein LolA [Sphingomonadales bacterium]
ISRFATVQPTANPNVISVEARDPKRPEFGRITMVFARQASAPGGLMLQGWVALDSQGNRTSIRLSNQQFGVPVSDQAFKWRDPKRGAVRN